MQSVWDTFLPALEAFGFWGYWLLAGLVFLQSLAPTSPLVPVSVIVLIAGGLSAHGVYDFWDLIWFVAVANMLGAELSYSIGAKSRDWAERQHRFVSPRRLQRSRRLLQRFGSAGLIIGRFVPMGAFVPLLAGVTGMRRPVFSAWNLAGAVAFAGIGISLGYGIGATLPVVTAAASLAGVFVLVLLAVVVLIWVLVVQLRRFLPFAASILRSVLRGVADNPDAQALAARHPRKFAWLGARLAGDRFAGLPATLFAVAFGYFALLYAGSVLDFVAGGPILQEDTSLANLFFAFRDPEMVWFFTIVSALGSWRTIIVVGLGASILVWRAGRGWQVPVLFLGWAGSQASVLALKPLFDRPRPDLAVYVEHTASFPSSYAAVSLFFYGFLTYLLVRDKLAPTLPTLLAGVTLVFMIGVSRVYLVEHFLSDVLNGSLIGWLWLVGAIWFVEWQRSRGKGLADPVRQPGGWGFRLAVVAVVAGGVVASVETYRQELNRLQAPAVTRLMVPVAQAFRNGTLAAYTESLSGEAQQPVSLVLLVRDKADLLDLFARSGWQLADRAGIRTLARAAQAAWLNKPYPTAPITPSFWEGRPNDFGIQLGTGEDTLRQRHHARFWLTNFLSPDGRQIVVGNASYDDGLKWGLTHHIDPNVDAERDFLVASFTATGLEAVAEKLQLTAPVLGQNMTGDPFFTDGVAVVLESPADLP